MRVGERTVQAEGIDASGIALATSAPTAHLDMPQGKSGRDRFYSTRLRQLLRLELEEEPARALWMEVVQHRQEMTRRLRRDPGQRVALLDYVVNVKPQLAEPQIIEKDELAAIERRASVDPLTGLFNREYFDLALPREVERCRRTGARSALVLMDLDRFKLVNDGEGHRKGDDVLRTVGGIVRDHVRSMDIPCRYGGDELAAILTETDAAEAHRVADRIRTAVAGRFRADPIAVTLSVGIAMLDASPPDGTDPFERADAALYAVKRSGGDGVAMATGPERLVERRRPRSAGRSQSDGPLVHRDGRS